jgi:hypothetical protein
VHDECDEEEMMRVKEQCQTIVAGATPNTDEPHDMEITIDLDGDGLPTNALIELVINGDAFTLPRAEVVERVARCLFHLRVAANRHGIPDGVCTNHGYYPHLHGAAYIDQCPTCFPHAAMAAVASGGEAA